MEERKKLKRPTSKVRPHGERQCHQWELKERNNEASIKNEEKERKARRVQVMVGNVLRFCVSRRGDKSCRDCHAREQAGPQGAWWPGGANRPDGGLMQRRRWASRWRARKVRRGQAMPGRRRPRLWRVYVNFLDHVNTVALHLDSDSVKGVGFLDHATTRCSS